MNLGQENVVITDTHYGKMTDATRMQVLEALSRKERNTDDEKELMLRYFSHQLVVGTPEHKMARKLVRKLEAECDDTEVIE